MSLHGWASQDERGKLTGGKAGDQTGKEVKTGQWYNFGQKYVLRYKNRSKAHKHAEALRKICERNLAGYDQGQRLTLYNELNKVNFDVDKLKAKCECDCSSLQNACAIIAGARKIQASAYTGIMVDVYKRSPDFEVLTDKKYLTSGDYLLEGDISVAPGKHTIGCIVDGPKASNKTTVDVAEPTLRKGDKGSQVKLLQRHLNSLNIANLDVDGDFGPKTESAVRAFQKKHDLSVDGIYGPKTYKKMVTEL